MLGCLSWRELMHCILKCLGRGAVTLTHFLYHKQTLTSLDPALYSAGSEHKEKFCRACSAVAGKEIFYGESIYQDSREHKNIDGPRQTVYHAGRGGT